MSQPPTLPERPTDNDEVRWRAYWWAQDQPWRWEPEIDVERQKYLTERRSIKPDWKQGIYPFKDIKLTRADVEWLLATHNNGKIGPVDWSDKSQHGLEGLDLRGANLRGVNLSFLPLARLITGLSVSKLIILANQIEAATICLEGADLTSAHLEGAELRSAHLEGANLRFAHLECAWLPSAHLEDANLTSAHLEGANLRFTHLEDANLTSAHLEGANLREAYFDSETKLNEIRLVDNKYGGASLVDVHWDDVNVAVIDWSSISELGDERTAKQQKTADGKSKDNATQLDDYRRAVRAYRQLAVVLHNQGLNEDAARFAYRAQMLQRTAFKLQKNFWQFLFSGFLDFLAGYGYRWWRSFRAYLIVILTFATAYFIIGCTVGPALSPIGSLVFSVTSFHGRGFFPGGIKLDDPLTIIAAFEAFIGLLIEVTFIATLTQRLFGK